MIVNDKPVGFEKYRLITVLTVTSVIGVLLIFIAVYNASRDLELIQEVDALHDFTKASLASAGTVDESVRALENLSNHRYQALMLENGSITVFPATSWQDDFPLNITLLEDSRINENGGHIETEDMAYTWAMLPIADSGKHAILVHQFTGRSPAILAKVYSRRLLIPGIFYVWLMIWVALIIRFLLGKLQEQNKKLAHMALHDSLTGLPNRNLLEDRLQIMIEDCRRHQREFALVILDLNQFKEVNDTYGHDQGDELLRQFADRVGYIIRAADTFARMGGDEFIMLLHDVSDESCILMCERVKESILRPYSLKEAEVNIGLSAGAAIFPKHGEEPATLMRHADEAMYASKSKGGSIYIYDDH